MQGRPEPQLQYKRQCCRRKRVNGVQDGEELRKQLIWGRRESPGGDFQILTQTRERGVNPLADEG